MKPYLDKEVTDSYVIREFDESIDPTELMWHRDKEDRLVEAIEATDWKVQLDNQMPVLLDRPIFIPKGVWHRAIKGSSTLKIKITKCI
jgi:hypothetical protein